MSSEPSSLPDYVLDPSAVLKDTAEWRNKTPPDYSRTRADFERTKKMTHEPGSLISIVENLVKNWEIEQSYKVNLAEWRTVDPNCYSFSVNGGPVRTGEEMLRLGTYNALLAPNEFYGPEQNDFKSSHVTFKGMMPTFAWEVLEVYCGPPRVVFRWRHWGEMRRDYSGINDKGERVKVPAHGGVLDIEGVTVALVNDSLQLQKIETWYDPNALFREMGKCPVMGGAAAAQE
ncbi:hypothetical protein HMN09_00979600 [Mycena chlorophos]|uniref:Pathogen-related protein n=1 Tax=Mycena chlorophos TaxID=658473 RepID=A0A8H6SIS4_MYCCL|nr:hypothetical protein HMN09_00979600 [Mycena chlorophos]